jgi:acyl-CoA synthetase (AMP-forming)/AMP-acid ligase II/acyl carrier protein
MHGGDASQVGAESAVTLVDIVQRRARAEAEHIAYRFLVDGESDERTLTYAALDAQARRIAVALAARGTEMARALLLYEPGLEFIAGLFGCFFAGVIAVPVFPPDPRDMASGLRRVQRLAADAAASIVLTSTAARAWIEPAAGLVPDLMQLEWCATDALRLGAETAWQPPSLDAARVALLQYTSGSSGTPKGVMVTHGNILAHGQAVEAALHLTRRTVVVSWLPLYHDMGLIGTVLIPMQIGFGSVQMSPLAFLERPRRWLQALSRYGGTLSAAPNFAYDLCVRRIAPVERRGLDLSTWTAAMNGSEPVRPESYERFIAAFEPCGFRRAAFRPCYGLAEATLMVAGGPPGTAPASLAVDGAALDRHRIVDTAPSRPGARVIMGCGRIVPGLDVVIVHPEACTACAADEVGEIWVAGAGVAAGYWGRSDATAAVFGAHVAESGKGPFLRTGDLGFVRDGVVFVTGRHKDLIVIRGRNYYPQDLERTAERAHSALRAGGGAAIPIDAGGEERLAIIHEIDPDDETIRAQVTTAIRNAVAREHQLHTHTVVLIRPRTLPKTSSGKVRRRACRRALDGGRLQVVEVWRADAGPQGSATTDLDRNDDAAVRVALPSVAEIGNWLVATIAELRDLPPAEVRPDDALIALGVDSAEVAQVAAGLEDWLARPVPLRLFREHPTIAALARAVREVSA